MQNRWFQLRVLTVFITLLIGFSSYADKGGDSSGGGGLMVEIVEVQSRDIIVTCRGTEEKIVCMDCALIVEPFKLLNRLNGVKCIKH